MIVSHSETDIFLTGSTHRLAWGGSLGKTAFSNRCHGAPTLRNGYGR